jgi:solute carrier family 25 phosphate transporter 23/24/25/41
VSGAIAGSVAQFCIFPFEVVKTRLALAENKVYSGIFDCMRKIVKFEGYPSLYKGLNASLLGILPYASTDLALFNLFKT